MVFMIQGWDLPKESLSEGRVLAVEDIPSGSFRFTNLGFRPRTEASGSRRRLRRRKCRMRRLNGPLRST